MQAAEVAAGVSLSGPHRDDLEFPVDGHDDVFGSRGQQRRRARAQTGRTRVPAAEVGEPPILLLDDVLSEWTSRRLVLERVGGECQTLITTTDVEAMPSEFLARSAVYEVRAGAVASVAGSAA